jgi:hypothetical protein
MPPRKRDIGDKRISTSYGRRRGDFAYDIAIYEAALPANPDRFYAHVANMVRLESGHTVSVIVELRAYGATLDEAVSKVDATVEEWVKDQARSN